MISQLSKKLAKQGGPKALALGQGVHTSTFPIKQGFAITPKPSKKTPKETTEADSASAHAQVLRARESERVTGRAIQFTTKFREASRIEGSNTKYSVILIAEGLGNLADTFYYTKDALKIAESMKLFEGAQCFADHPSKLEEEIRPERSTRDIIGYFEDVKYVEDKGQGQLVGSLVVTRIPSLDWVHSLLSNSVEYSQKFKESDLIGLSINANGEANVVPIDEFLKSYEVPDSAKTKITQAVEAGVREVKVVSKLSEAISCDLVTRAGAGGRILKMLEHERNRMKKKVKESEMEKKEAVEKKEAAPAVEAQPEHKDEQQDKELFARMIKQYLGDEADHEDGETVEMAKHAYEAYHSEGMDETAAYEAAGKHLQMAMKIGKGLAAKKEADPEKPEDEGKKEEPKEEKKEAEEKQEAKEADECKEGEAHETKESEKVLKLTAEVAKLREALKTYELKDYLDKKLMESKKPVAVTKKFREALGSPKSKEQIDTSYKMFMAAFEAKEEEASEVTGFVFTEKQPTFKESEGENTMGSFSDCLS